ncbi:MAG: sortase [Chloroflexia bacterium]|jgi:sortase A|nr:sortase [Chloroflexia bacterium]
MLKIGTGKSRSQLEGVVNPAVGADGYIKSDSKHQARKPVPFLRVLGNLLIVAGLALLVGIGAWWGYTQHENQQFLDNAVQTGLQIEPTIDVASLGSDPSTPTAVPPTATPVIIEELADLTSQKGPAVGQSLIPTATPVPDDSPPIHLSIPSVGIDTNVVPVNWSMIPAKGGGIKPEWQVADFAVGHHAGSANPGQVGNVVLSGHDDYKGEVFKNLHDVKDGDLVTVYTEKGQYIYVITSRVLVKEEGVPEAQKRQNARYMDPTSEPTLTMITCWPYGIDDHRFIAIAKPYKPATSEQSEYSLR